MIKKIPKIIIIELGFLSYWCIQLSKYASITIKKGTHLHSIRSRHSDRCPHLPADKEIKGCTFFLTVPFIFV